jgi:hypothetical protein
VLDAEGLEASITSQREAERVGARVSVHLEDSTIVRTVWIRNFGWDVGFMPEAVAQHAAEYLAFKEAVDLMSQQRRADGQ